MTISEVGSPQVRAWAARITSMSSEVGGAVGRPSRRDCAQSSAARRRAGSFSGKYWPEPALTNASSR